MMEPLHQIENAFCVSLIQISGGFIRQQQRRLVDKRSRDGHALLLAPGKLSGTLSPATTQPHFTQPLASRLQRLLQSLASNQERHGHVFRGREIGKQMVPLPHKTHDAIAILRQFFFRKRPQRISGEVYFTTRWGVQRSQQVEQSAFPRAGGPYDRDHLAAFNNQVDLVERRDFLQTRAEDFCEVLRSQEHGGVFGDSDI
jgi:acyl-CoA thioesterase-1